MTTKAPQIVHESEAQRQHVRIQIPAYAFLDGEQYAVKDLSNGGVRLLDVSQHYSIGADVEISLTLPFEEFSLVVDFKAEVEHYTLAEKLLGCKFVELSTDQISILNNVIQSYISGNIASEGDIINIVSRNNFSPARKKSTGEIKITKKDIVKRAIPMMIVFLFCLAGTFFLVGNIFEKTSIIKSYQGVVESEIITVRAPTDGLFTSLVSEKTQTVAVGEPIGELHLRVLSSSTEGGGKRFTSVTETIKSPCECHIDYQHVQDRVFRSVGEPLFNLIPIDAEPWVTVHVPAKEAHRINIHDDVKLHIAGEKITAEGIVLHLGTDTKSPDLVVKVQPTDYLPEDLVGRPVYAEFFVY